MVTYGFSYSKEIIITFIPINSQLFLCLSLFMIFWNFYLIRFWY